MTPCRVLRVDANRGASVPVLNALREMGIALEVVSCLSQSVVGLGPFDAVCPTRLAASAGSSATKTLSEIPLNQWGTRKEVL